MWMLRLAYRRHFSVAIIALNIVLSTHLDILSINIGLGLRRPRDTAASVQSYAGSISIVIQTAAALTK